MAARKFRPTLLSSLITFALFGVMIWLGTWQVHRMHWKEDMLAQINENMARKPVPMPEKIDNPEDWKFRRVTLAGSFDYSHEMLVKPRTLDGAVGYDMVVPFIRASGGTVLVDRGWISDALMDKASRPDHGMMQIEGVLRTPEKPNFFTPDNNPAKKDWFWTDVKGMADAAGLEDVAPMVLYISAKPPGVYPVGGRVQGLQITILPSDHKQYAIFWFGMSFVLLIVWFLSHLERAPLEEKHASL
jgi:surfeit locus 1 family protein